MDKGDDDVDLVEREVRATDRAFGRRKSIDRVSCYLRSCAVCASFLPPIDFLCPSCWRELGRLMNRGANLRQADFVFPTYSLLTWTPATEWFVRPFIYAFKKGHAIRGGEKFAALFLSERLLSERRSSVHAGARDLFLSAPSARFDHSVLWTEVLARQCQAPAFSPFRDKAGATERQKQLRQGERGNRRYVIKEDFAKWAEGVRGAKRIVFADDVITSGSTAMAAYMALGDPDGFEVWTLVARPRLAAKVGAC